MLSILTLVSRFGLSGNPSKVQKTYAEMIKNDPRAGPDEATAKRMLDEFYREENRVLRLMMFKDRVNCSRRKGNVTLLVYYINCKEHERVNNCFSFVSIDAAKLAIKTFEANLQRKEQLEKIEI